jgi:hypothetical protein
MQEIAFSRCLVIRQRMALAWLSSVKGCET